MGEFSDPFGEGKFLLEVALTVEVGGLHVAHRVFLAGVEEEEVGGDDLGIANLDKISHLHFLPHDFLVDAVPEHLGFAGVDLLVADMPFLGGSEGTWSS
jgi:hypothetical protein